MVGVFTPQKLTETTNQGFTSPARELFYQHASEPNPSLQIEVQKGERLCKATKLGNS